MGKTLKTKRHGLGFKHFGPVVQITDPCYDHDVWCRMETEVVPGDYECISWECTNKADAGRVAICGIYLGGFVPSQDSMEEIGEIGVDAGLAGFFTDKPDYSDAEWAAFCGKLDFDLKKRAWIFDEGFFTSSGHGDGGYPVYAAKANERTCALEIRFM